MINQEEGALGSFPELRRDAEAAVRYVNEELGGVDNRPIRLEVCVTAGTAESSQRCATELVAKGVVAVLGGIDVAAGSAVPVLEAAKVPYLGMTPSLGDELVNPSAFMFAGGVVADLLAQTEYVTGTLKATKVGVVHLDLPGLQDAAVLAARAILQMRGVTDLKIVAQKADATDFTPAVRAATASNPDVLMAVFPAQGCVKVLGAVRTLRARARLFLPSACATPAVLDGVGAGGAAGVTFASAFVPHTDTADPEVATYVAKLRQYGPANATPSVLSQAGFALVMTVHRLLAPLGGDKVTAAAIAKVAKAAREAPAFMGHPYTCDGQVVTILPAMCSAWVRLLEYKGDGRFDDVVGTWMTGAPLVKLLTG
ncbi:MAG: ABC transporter substrate-binding protein [Acidimicrobiales bacterium]